MSSYVTSLGYFYSEVPRGIIVWPPNPVCGQERPLKGLGLIHQGNLLDILAPTSLNLNYFANKSNPGVLFI